MHEPDVLRRAPLKPAVAPMLPYPSKLYVETTTRCNLACPMCVKQAWGRDEPEGLFAPGLFDQIVPAFQHLDALILNGIGEPLLHPRLEKFIAIAKENMPKTGWVGFQTNGLLINEARATSLVEAGVDKICISVDAVDPRMYRSLRSGRELGRMESAFSSLQRAQKKSPGSRLRIGIEFVMMRDNHLGLPEVLRWAARHGVTFAIVTHLLPYHEAMAGQTLFDANTDVVVSLFRRWRDKAAQEGVDIYRYPSVYLKYGRTTEEQRVFDTVEAMKTEAISEGVFLHLDSLLKRGDMRSQQVAAVLEESRAVAAGLGMDIRLPEAAPKSRRTCEFVEEGGAFVSWDGNVHPCYFLWHRYPCYIDGFRKFVKPRVFGSLKKQGILAIWNSPDFRSFRKNVTGYDYPFCFNCSFALCDYVQGEEFVQDCYGNTEPCGACLWCMGVFHCLR